MYTIIFWNKGKGFKKRIIDTWNFMFPVPEASVPAVEI